ncbi:unnamed protein product [Rhizoctonia solani]|uniref:AGC/YANK protein kinase n=1 Tax=Rhizoctonia solani TaxID=456999 RepID=A0A8H3AE56_9AGAM|nr:unnamed protein product [Rhizoctonia solani]
MDPEVQIRVPLDVPAEEDLLKQPVFPLIHAIKKDIEERIDSSLSWDQLNAIDVNYSIFRPLVFKYAKHRNYSIVYACLVVRTHFINSASQDLAFAPLKLTRADACELLALKLLRRFTGDSNNPIDLFSVLTVSWDPLQGCPDSCLGDIREIAGEDVQRGESASALEIAISSEAKRFIASPLVQTCITDIHTGRVVFSAPATRGSILADNYKQKHVQVYDVHHTPWLDHYRLRVPRYRGIMEFVDFAVLLFLFVLCLHNKNFEYMNWTEIVFIVFAFGFLLDELTAALEHGWDVYIQNMWNGFDLAFAAIFIGFLGCRCRALVKQDYWWNDLAFDILACGACILFPRLAFFLIKNNLIILALQGMIAEFFVFIMLAAVCFSGLLFTLWTLSRGSATWTLPKIAWLMTQVWFGNTFLSFTVAESFHPVFGPILMVIFAALSNTLLITIMISILSNTFARINEHASEEYLYQFAISTLEGVKSDALFSYQPPFNIVALLFLYPLSTCLSPRQLHTVNVLLIRITSFPQLIVIGIYERYFAPGSRFITTTKVTGSSMFDSLSRQFRFVETFMGSSRDNVMDAIFDIDVPPNVTNVFSTDERELGMEDSDTFGKAQEPEEEARRGRPELTLSPTPRRDLSQASRTYHEEQPNSPLARLFGSVRQRAISAQGDALGDIKKIGEAMESLKVAAMPSDKLRQEIRELSERQPIDFEGEVTLFHFVLLRSVGKGAFGKVRVVQHKQTRDLYALKYINKAKCVKMKAVANIIQERRLLEEIDHPFVVNLRYAFQDDENCFFVLDLMLGGDLRFHLERLGSLSEDAVRFYVAEIASALTFLHEKRIIHRDLKPDNILLDEKGHAHITDMNIAVHYSERRMLTGVAGSMAYMAPEVLTKKGYTYTIDWWSLGVCAYELIFGKRPFRGKTNSDLTHAITRDSLKFPEDASTKCSREGVYVLMGLLERDTTRRLGCKPNGEGFEELKKQAWFKNFDWDRLEDKELEPPFVPDSKRANFDATHELEELLLEDNPLKARPRKANQDVTQLSAEMRQMEEQQVDS